MRKGNTESLVSFYAAGVGVMFLLFSVAGASSTLLDEVDSGTLDRVLSTRVGMGGLLAGKWIFITLMGMLSSPSCSAGSRGWAASRASSDGFHDHDHVGSMLQLTIMFGSLDGYRCSGGTGSCRTAFGLDDR